MFNFSCYVELNQQFRSPFLKENVKIMLYLSLPVAFYIKLATPTILSNGKHLVCYHCKPKFMYRLMIYVTAVMPLADWFTLHI
jgi:hypothetical protein